MMASFKRVPATSADDPAIPPKVLPKIVPVPLPLIWCGRPLRLIPDAVIVVSVL